MQAVCPLRTRSLACCVCSVFPWHIVFSPNLLDRRTSRAPTTTTRKRETRMRESSARGCRIWWAPTSTPAAVVLVLLLLIISSSSSDVADGVRTATRTSGPGDAAGVHDDDAEAAPPAAGVHHASSRRATYRPEDRSDDDEGSLVVEKDKQWWLKAERAATGSRLPDCGHACGPCSPCRRVIVSFRCALASESCPIAYRCMCRGRFFRVPSL